MQLEHIQRAVAAHFKVGVADLVGARKTQRIAFCRQVAMYLCRRCSADSFPKIGRAFGRDHSTVIHAYRLIAGRVATDAAFRRLMGELEEEQKTMKLTIEIDLDNAAFDDHRDDELGRVLAQVRDHLTNYADVLTVRDRHTLVDRNGNTVGQWEIS